MRYWLLSISLLFITAFTNPTRPARIDVTGDEATVEFPDRVTFSATISSDAEIQNVILEYGISNQTTCGTVIAKAFPAFETGTATDVTWTWEMRQSGSEPPGTEIWWRWRVTNADGTQEVSETQTVLWLDAEHPWKTQTGGNVNLHWYEGNQSFGNTLHSSALQSLAALEEETGVKADAPIDLYIYGNVDDMRDAVLYEPGWTGGQAFPDHDIVIIGIAPADIEWGQRTQAHELTHVLVGHLTFSCLGVVPTWLNEGLAVYGEGGPDEDGQQRLDDAIDDNSLLPVRALSGGFAEDPAQANLSYSQSYSIVNFLIEAYGREKMIALLQALRDSTAIDEALQQTYGFNVEGLEDEWRAAISAQPRAAESLPTATSQPTIVPTLVPISGIPAANATLIAGSEPTATTVVEAVATQSVVATPAAVTTSGLPNLLMGLAVVCICVAGIALPLFAITMVLANRRRSL